MVLPIIEGGGEKMKKYQILHKVLSLRRLMMLSVTLILFILLNIIPVRVLATNGGLVTTADKTYAFDYKTHILGSGLPIACLKLHLISPHQVQVRLMATVIRGHLHLRNCLTVITDW